MKDMSGWSLNCGVEWNSLVGLFERRWGSVENALSTSVRTIAMNEVDTLSTALGRSHAIYKLACIY